MTTRGQFPRIAVRGSKVKAGAGRKETQQIPLGLARNVLSKLAKSCAIPAKCRTGAPERDDWTGPSFQTCANAGTICRAFESTSRRHEVLTFEHLVPARGAYDLEANDAI